MNTTRLGQGSLPIIEEFFGAEVGKVTGRDVERLSGADFMRLRSALAPLFRDGEPDSRAARLSPDEFLAAWAHEAQPRPTARAAVSEVWDAASAAVPLSIYVDQVVCEDPLTLRLPDVIARGVDRLVDLAPLVRDGSVLLTPPKLSLEMGLSSLNREYVNAIGKHLPWFGYQNEDTIMLANELYIARSLGVSPVAVASRAGLLDDVLGETSQRVVVENRVGPLLLPSFSDLSGQNVAALRGDSAALREVRTAIEDIDRHLPPEGVDPVALAELADDIFRPRVEALRKEIKRWPTIEAGVGFATAIGIGSATFATVGPTLPAIAALGASPIPPLISVAKQRRAGRTPHLATRFLVELTPPGIDPALLTEDNRRRSRD